MNRIIKFRAWGPKSKYMISPEVIEKWQIEELMDGTYIPMQFTGLTDRNGIEIYEHDLVRIGNMIWEIRYYVRNGQWVPCTTEFITTDNHLSSAGSPMRNFNWLDCGEAVNLRDFNKPMGKTVKVEVIGNIYENPDLLKEDSVEAKKR